MNKIYKITKNDIVLLTPSELAEAANEIARIKIFAWWDFDERNPRNRLAGSGHCDCHGDGEFILLPINDPSVVEGGKRYMFCRKCGCYSHL